MVKSIAIVLFFFFGFIQIQTLDDWRQLIKGDYGNQYSWVAFEQGFCVLGFLLVYYLYYVLE